MSMALRDFWWPQIRNITLQYITIYGTFVAWEFIATFPNPQYSLSIIGFNLWPLIPMG